MISILLNLCLSGLILSDQTEVMYGIVLLFGFLCAISHSHGSLTYLMQNRCLHILVSHYGTYYLLLLIRGNFRDIQAWVLIAASRISSRVEKTQSILLHNPLMKRQRLAMTTDESWFMPTPSSMTPHNRQQQRAVVEEKFGPCLGCECGYMDLVIEMKKRSEDCGCFWKPVPGIASSNKPFLSCRRCTFRTDPDSYKAFREMVSCYESLKSAHNADGVSDDERVEDDVGTMVTDTSDLLFGECVDTTTSTLTSSSSGGDSIQSLMTLPETMHGAAGTTKDSHDRTRCPSCGESVVGADWRFCPHCGNFLAWQHKHGALLECAKYGIQWRSR